MVKIYKNFKEKKSFKLAVAADNLFGGPWAPLHAPPPRLKGDWGGGRGKLSRLRD